MKYELLFDNFISVLKDSVTQNTKISAVLSEILQIEKEAVYRRLRMEVPFTFSEIATVSQALGLSLDNIMGAIPSKTRPLKMTLTEYVDPQEIDYGMMESWVSLLRQVKKSGDAEYTMSCCTLPQIIYHPYESITRFFLFRWMYLYGSSVNVRPYSDIPIPDRMRKAQLDHMQEVKEYRMSSFIWDKNIFRHFVDDVKHFHSVFMITDQEVEKIKEELNEMVNYMEECAVMGRYPETNHRVNFYICNLSSENTYLTLDSPNYKLAMTNVFDLNGIATQDDKTYQKVCGWIRSLKRVSTMISESGEKQRVMFFEKQRKVIDML